MIEKYNFFLSSSRKEVLKKKSMNHNENVITIFGQTNKMCQFS